MSEMIAMTQEEYDNLQTTRKLVLQKLAQYEQLTDNLRGILSDHLQGSQYYTKRLWRIDWEQYGYYVQHERKYTGCAVLYYRVDSGKDENRDEKSWMKVWEETGYEPYATVGKAILRIQDLEVELDMGIPKSEMCMFYYQNVMWKYLCPITVPKGIRGKAIDDMLTIDVPIISYKHMRVFVTGECVYIGTQCYLNGEVIFQANAGEFAHEQCVRGDDVVIAHIREKYAASTVYICDAGRMPIVHI